jgi:hypothetical protein
LRQQILNLDTLDNVMLRETLPEFGRVNGELSHRHWFIEQEHRSHKDGGRHQRDRNGPH